MFTSLRRKKDSRILREQLCFYRCNANVDEIRRYPAIAQGAVTIGLVYIIVSLIIKKIGAAWLDKILPPIVVGPVIMVIGLGLAANAAQNAMYNGDIYDFKFILVALVYIGIDDFLQHVFARVSWLDPHLTRDHWWLLSSFSYWDRDVQPIIDAAWFSLPSFEIPFVQYKPTLHLNAITTMAPIAFCHDDRIIWRHLMVLNKLTKRNF